MTLHVVLEPNPARAVSLLASAGVPHMFATLDAPAQSRRVLTTSLSLGGEALAIATLMAAPLLYNAALPNLYSHVPISAPRSIGNVQVVAESSGGANTHSTAAVAPLAIHAPHVI